MSNARTFFLLLLLGSLATNAFQLFRFDRRVTSIHPPSAKTSTPNSLEVSRAAWQSLYNQDLGLFARNLRDAGVPDRWINTVISAEIEKQFRSREEQLFPPKKLKFWQRDDSIPSLQTSLALLDLRREKAKLRLAVLGPDTIPADPFSPYADMPATSRELVQTIKEDYDTMIQALRKKAGFMPSSGDREQILYVESEKVRELQQYLSNTELVVLEMRTSALTDKLRQEFKYTPVTEAEFTAIYRARQGLEKFSRRIEGDVDSFDTDRENYQAREQEKQRLTNELANTLGPDRYAVYLHAADFEYRGLQNLVYRAGLQVSTADQIFNLRDTVSAESNRIYDNSSLGLTQKRTAFKELADKTREQFITLLGKEAGEAYGRRGWLRSVEKGGALNFHLNGYSIKPLDPED